MGLVSLLFHGLLVTGMGSDKGGVYPVVVGLGRYDNLPGIDALVEMAKRRATEPPPRARRAYHLFLSKRGGKRTTTKVGKVAVARKDDCINVPCVFALDDAIRFAREIERGCA